MEHLILVKHAPPEVDPNVSSEKWNLGEKGRTSCERLAQKLRPYAIESIVTSAEPKAVQTGELLAEALGVKSRSIKGLEEHDRRNVPHMRSAEFISMMELFFRKPDELVLGDETAQEALARFDSAVHQIVQSSDHKTLAIVTHGTVLALFLEKCGAQKRGFDLWRSLGLPSFVVMKMPGFKIIETVERV